MSRSDLLALTHDDLTVLSNRGLVKRALKELNSEKLTSQLTENEAEITIAWSDEVECVLPAGEKISDRHCSCAATNICRHLIRSILLYQSQHQDLAIENRSEGETLKQSLENINQEKISTIKAWNPGTISDEELASHYPKATISRSKREFNSQVIEVIKAIKPIARIHTLAYTVRFLVPGDIRYTYCDCAETAPCRHVLYAVWAFRLLDKDQNSGIISTQIEDLPIPIELLDDLERTLQDLLAVGIRGISAPLTGRLQRLADQCRQEELIWLGEIISELIQMSDFYTNRDARFSPLKLVELIGELCIRSDAIHNNIDTVPQLFIRGSKADKLTKIGSARLIGLGCGVQVKKQTVILTSYLQDTDSGTVVAVCHEFIESQEEDTELPAFSQLAEKSLVKRVSLGSLGAGQMLVKGGKRSPNYQFIPGRSQIVINPQTFQWSELRSPLLVEDFDLLKAHLQLQPPASLRPRRLTENFHVLAVASVESVQFSSAEQQVTAILKDSNHNSVELKFPYNQRSRSGTDLLLSWLNNEKLKFVAGQVSSSTSGITIEPVSIVREDGKTHEILQPWIATSEENITQTQFKASPSIKLDPLQYYLQQLKQALSDLWLIGIERIDIKTIQDWEQLSQLGGELGLVHMTAKCDRVLGEFRTGFSQLNNKELLAKTILEITVLIQIASS